MKYFGSSIDVSKCFLHLLFKRKSRLLLIFNNITLRYFQIFNSLSVQSELPILAEGESP